MAFDDDIKLRIKKIEKLKTKTKQEKQMEQILIYLDGINKKIDLCFKVLMEII